MQVYDISVRFMRKVQVKEYEPMEAETSLKASLAEGEDHVTVATALMSQAKGVVINSGLKAGVDKAETTAAPKPEAKPATATKTETKAAAPKTEAKPATAPKVETPAAPTADEFDEFGGTTAAAAPTAMAPKELQDWIVSQIDAKKIAVADVKAIVSKYSTTGRSTDVPEAQRQTVKDEITAALKP